jgi:hypothetical protein
LVTDLELLALLMVLKVIVCDLLTLQRAGLRPPCLLAILTSCGAGRLFQGLNSAISGFDSRNQIVDGSEDLRIGRPPIVSDWRYIRSTDWESRPHSNPRHSLTRACVGPPARSPDQRSDQTTAATTGQGNLAANGHHLTFYR